MNCSWSMGTNTTKSLIILSLKSNRHIFASCFRELQFKRTLLMCALSLQPYINFELDLEFELVSWQSQAPTLIARWRHRLQLATSSYHHFGPPTHKFGSRSGSTIYHATHCCSAEQICSCSLRPAVGNRAKSLRIAAYTSRWPSVRCAQGAAYP